MTCRRGGTGRRAGLKIPFWQQSAGSTPAAGTNFIKHFQGVQNGVNNMKKSKFMILTAVLLTAVLILCACGTPKTQTAYELVKSASEKTAALSSSQVDMTTTIKMSIMGMNVELPMKYNIKASSEGGKTTAAALMEMSSMGESIKTNIYIDGEDLYIDSGEDGKFKASLKDEELAAGFNVTEMKDSLAKTLPEDILKDVEVVNGENGLKTVTVEIAEDKFKEIFSEYTDSALGNALGELGGEDSIDISFSNIKAEISVNKDGYFADYKLFFDMNMKMDIEGVSMDLSASCDTDCVYVDPGTKVVVELPADLDQYKSIN